MDGIVKPNVDIESASIRFISELAIIKAKLLDKENMTVQREDAIEELFHDAIKKIGVARLLVKEAMEK